MYDRFINMGMGTNFHAMYKHTRTHLRKTKEKMIQPFDWKTGKKGKALHKGKPLTEKQKIEIRNKLRKQNRKSLTMNLLKALILIIAVVVFLFFSLSHGK